MLLRARSLEPVLREVRLDVRLRDDAEPRVGVGRLHQPARDVVQVELHDRVEALQVGLLVDREGQVAGVDALR